MAFTAYTLGVPGGDRALIKSELDKVYGSVEVLDESISFSRTMIRKAGSDNAVVAVVFDQSSHDEYSSVQKDLYSSSKYHIYDGTAGLKEYLSRVFGSVFDGESVSPATVSGGSATAGEVSSAVEGGSLVDPAPIPSTPGPSLEIPEYVPGYRPGVNKKMPEVSTEGSETYSDLGVGETLRVPSTPTFEPVSLEPPVNTENVPGFHREDPRYSAEEFEYLTRQVAGYKATIANLHEQIAEYEAGTVPGSVDEAELARAEARSADLEKSYRALAEQYNAVVKDHSALQSKVQSYEQDASRLSVRAQELSAKEAEVKSVREDLHLSRIRVTELESSLSSVKTELSDAQSEISRQSDYISSVREVFAQKSDQDSAAHKAEISKLKSLHDSEVDGYKSRISDLEKDLHEVKVRLDSVPDTYDEGTDSFGEDLSAELDDISRRLQDAELDNLKKDEEIRALRADISSLSSAASGMINVDDAEELENLRDSLYGALANNSGVTAEAFPLFEGAGYRNLTFIFGGSKDINTESYRYCEQLISGFVDQNLPEQFTDSTRKKVCALVDLSTESHAAYRFGLKFKSNITYPSWLTKGGSLSPYLVLSELRSGDENSILYGMPAYILASSNYVNEMFMYNIDWGRRISDLDDYMGRKRLHGFVYMGDLSATHVRGLYSAIRPHNAVHVVVDGNIAGVSHCYYNLKKLPTQGPQSYARVVDNNGYAIVNKILSRYPQLNFIVE